ncbi:MAG TPA: undecaprenyl-diphosphatase UppP [Myxococcales bacterium]|nr:undecaprenyl-diphosphatase UppP [Myxococcales bacterium]
MSLWQSAVLGIVQGLTEFLPVSSTAHLKIAEAAMGIQRGDPFLTSFDVIIQLGTLFAVLVYFRDMIVRMARALWAGLRQGDPLGTQDARLAWFVIVGTIPVGLLGLAFEKAIERLDLNEGVLLTVIGGSLIALALVLFLAERLGQQRRGLGELSWLDAAVVGLAQALAIVPGVSRSGVTLTAGLFAGIRRDDAARFSFLLSIPAVGAAGGWKLLHLIRHHELPAGSAALTNLIVGTVVSMIVGYGVIAWLLAYLRTRKTHPFVVWRLAMGALLLVMVGRGAVAAGGARLADAPAAVR